MGQDSGLRLLVARKDLGRTRFAPDPDAPGTRELADGEVRLAIDRFALTANNVTYAAFGDAMRYWQFFPTGDPAWGCVPVWGFARVAESRAAGVEVGRRVWAFLPMGSYLVVRAGAVRARGFADDSAHRADLPGVYNQLEFCDADPGYRPELEAHQALLRPLFTTAFLIADFLASSGWFGAQRVMFSSASSKTAYATAFCMERDEGASTVRRVGLTSRANRDFTSELGCYDELVVYDDVDRADPGSRTVYVDLSGDAGVRRRIHEVLGEALVYDCAVGGTHWQQLGTSGGLPGPRPVLFFAPSQYQRRAAPPPDGLGAAELHARLGRAWQAFLSATSAPGNRWLEVDAGSGSEAVEAAYRSLAEGRADPRRGRVLAF